MLKQLATLLAAAALVAGGVVASVALANNGHGPPSSPPGQGECEHGNSGKPCKPDPQPEHGKDCEHHGKNGGVNEDHCKPPDTTPTDTTPTDTTPTTPTDTTPTTPTETTPTTPEQPRCPPGEGPYAGKDGQEGNDECCPDVDNNQQCDGPTPPPTQTTSTPPPVTPAGTSTPLATNTPATPATPTTKTTPKVMRTSSKAKPPARAKKKQPKLTGNPNVDKCKDLGDGTLNCKGVVVTQGNG